MVANLYQIGLLLTGVMLFISSITLSRVLKRVEVLEGAIREHRDARGDDRCWIDDLTLYKTLGPDEVPEDAKLALPVREAFLSRCEAYWEHRQNPYCEPWKTVEALEQEIAHWREHVERVEAIVGKPNPSQGIYTETLVQRLVDERDALKEKLITMEKA